MCVTIELDYKEVLARRMPFDKDIKFCVNESLEECAIQLLPHYKVRFMAVRRNKWEKIGKTLPLIARGGRMVGFYVW